MRGIVKQKTILRFKNDIFNYIVILSEGEFNINMPYYKEGDIPELVDIELYKDVEFEANTG